MFRETMLRLTNGWGEGSDLHLLEIMGKGGAVNAQCFLSLTDLQLLRIAIDDMLIQASVDRLTT